MTSDGDENSSQWALATSHGPACFLAAGAELQKGQVSTCTTALHTRVYCAGEVGETRVLMTPPLQMPPHLSSHQRTLSVVPAHPPIVIM